MSVPLRLLPGVVVGATLGVGFGVAARVRRARPLHPHGRRGAAVLEVTSPDPDLGVPLLAHRGRHACLVRWSYSLGLPAPLPDVEGMAVRIVDGADLAGAGAGPADLLFAGSGTGRLARFLLVPRGRHRHGTVGTLIPVASSAGPLLFTLTPVGGSEPPGPPGLPTRWELAAASARSSWRTLGVLVVDSWGGDDGTRFDPIEHELAGTWQYPVVSVLREPAYAAARLGVRLDAGLDAAGAAQ